MRDLLPEAIRENLVNILLGFFGALAAVLILPRFLKLIMRTVVVTVVKEIALLVVMGFLTDFVSGWLSEETEPQTLEAAEDAAA